MRLPSIFCIFIPNKVVLTVTVVTQECKEKLQGAQNTACLRLV